MNSYLETTMSLSSYQSITQFDSLKNLQKRLQDLSLNHGHQLGQGIDVLKQHHLFWAVARLHVRLLLPLDSLQTYRVRTWVNAMEPLGVNRHYEVCDAFNQCVALAVGRWVLVDDEQFILKKTTSFSFLKGTQEQTDETCVFQPLFKTYPFLDEEASTISYRPVQDSDIDFNHHVNNVVYLDYIHAALDTINETRSIVEYQITYSRSLFINDIIKLTIQINDNMAYISGVQSSSMAIAFRALVVLK